jgi:hypothetical protein
MMMEQAESIKKPSSSGGSPPDIAAFIERRKYLRSPLVILEVKWKQYDRIFMGKAEDLGTGGMKLSTDETLQVGTRFPIEFVLPGDRTAIRCTGEVVWRKIYVDQGEGSEDAGIRFTDLEPKQMRTIERWLAQQKPSSSKKGSRKTKDA